jgi:hypothetical protein
MIPATYPASTPPLSAPTLSTFSRAAHRVLLSEFLLGWCETMSHYSVIFRTLNFSRIGGITNSGM